MADHLLQCPLEAWDGWKSCGSVLAARLAAILHIFKATLDKRPCAPRSLAASHTEISGFDQGSGHGLTKFTRARKTSGGFRQNWPGRHLHISGLKPGHWLGRDIIAHLWSRGRIGLRHVLQNCSAKRFLSKLKPLAARGPVWLQLMCETNVTMDEPESCKVCGPLVF